MNEQSQLLHGIIAPNRSIAATLMLVDRLGTFFRVRRAQPGRIDSLLIVFFGSFGDGLMFTSILRSLRENMPHARIDILASTDVGAMLKGCPYVSNLIITDMPSGKKYPSRVPGLIRLMRGFGLTYDLALCPRGPIDNGVVPLYLSGIARYIVGFSTGGFSFLLDKVVPWRPGIHETEHLLDVIQAVCPLCKLGPQELFYDREATGYSLESKFTRIAILPATKFIVVHPGSKVMRRSLSIDRWRAVLRDLLLHTDAMILITGVESEWALYESFEMHHPRIVPTLGMFTIPELAALIKLSSGVVTIETFVAHLAGVTGVPAVAFWTGVTDVRQWRPVGINVEVASVNPPCSPCFRWCDDPICMEHDTARAMIHLIPKIGSTGDRQESSAEADSTSLVHIGERNGRGRL